ncbi:Cdc7p-Dbf4p kinase complex regulatory subunit [Marasmius tenuissimus]|uniref:Cdc7p-Dbf4p kinase complex regulatory subunit n=1 Tax=Marasmius tenuissimus TaxID=585030 RepID=A0ABR3AFW0_9AGAR|nr:Cdc7p-Dbf4p kinase complex regulatory subunit [Marasmius tenuissimus]
MATAERSSLSSRALPRVPMSPLKPSRVPSGTKRPRSPGLGAEEQSSRTTSKRARPTAATPTSQKNKSREKKDQQEAEFRRKYKEAWPSWSFHFDMTDITDEALVAKLKRRILELEGTIEDFFSKEHVTHFICSDVDRPTKPTAEEIIEKENRGALRKSPSKQGFTAPPELPDGTSSLAKARDYMKNGHMKIWSVKKLDSVVSRCLEQPLLLSTKPPSTNNSSKQNTNQPRSLTRLLQTERLNGASERDPTQRRSDFRYFQKGTCFVLVEDVQEKLATIAAQEYMVPKRSSAKAPWPILYCHPKSRGPFVPFDDREKRRWERNQVAEKECRREQEAYRKKKMKQFEEVVKMKEAQKELRRTGDLRRSVSMNNLRRQGPMEDYDVFDDGDRDSVYESANASGYLASGPGGYMAASGNSVHITSTTGNTSTTSGNTLRRTKLPANLQLVANREVVTSRKVARPIGDQDEQEMGPPVIPGRQTLRKSKSTNTIKLAKREEGSKPGYCESCRQKFEDFKQHVVSHKHRKFAADDANFSQLDCVLSRVKRKTVVEVRRERTKPTMLFDDDYDQGVSDEDMYDVQNEL